MRAGRLREQVAFERLVPGADIYGNVVTAWAPVEISPGQPLRVWADIRETLGKERVDAGRIEASRTATVRVRAFDETRAITPADRMIARDQTWNIRSIVPVGNDMAMLDILCERGVAA